MTPRTLSIWSAAMIVVGIGAASAISYGMAGLDTLQPGPLDNAASSIAAFVLALVMYQGT